MKHEVTFPSIMFIRQIQYLYETAALCYMREIIPRHANWLTAPALEKCLYKEQNVGLFMFALEDF
jgi:hypothetical protein